ncbi:hypothetical protein FQN50_001399 [Emmonsiellopsis sp. PD_5]|nr:hypothetical protein FQN50_001399 [Emmonsiellopsis sp. PD_5]
METVALPPEQPRTTRRKRKSVDEEEGLGLPAAKKKPVQRRASAACRSCRARKVRCDVLLKSTPCTNCRLDGSECVIAESKRTKFARAANGATFRIDGQEKDGEGGSKDVAQTKQAPIKEVIECSRSHSVERSNESDNSDYEIQQQTTSEPVIVHDMVLNNMVTIMHQLFGPSPNMGKTHAQLELPRYIKEFPPHVEADDIDYLQAKGALKIPHFALRNELLKCFVNYVYVYMPLLDLGDFLQTISENNGQRRTSLLLFQAVMFAGTAFVDLKHLRMAGYQSRKAARKTFYKRARALYDLDYEEDRITIIQSLLLMSYWFETPNDQKDNWHWVGISLSLARLHGLHLNITTAGIDTATQRIWRRIWWCLYIRDKLIALGMRRPTRITDGEYDLPIANLNDFEFFEFPAHLRQIVGNCEVLSNPTYQREFALLYIEKVKLCRHLHHVLSVQYHTPQHDINVTPTSRMELIPKREVAEISQVRHYDDALDKWFANTPQETKYSPRFGSELSEGEEVLHTHRAMLKLTYLSTRSTLHLPQILRALPNKLPPDLHLNSLKKVRQTAAEITDIAQDLHRLNLTRYLPAYGTTPLLSAVATHAIDITSHDPTIKLNSLNRLHQCLQTLLRLKEIYSAADVVTSALEKIMSEVGVQLYTYKPWATTQQGDAQTQLLPDNDLASRVRGCYSNRVSPKASPPSLIVLDSMADSPSVKDEGYSTSEQENEHGVENVHVDVDAGVGVDTAGDVDERSSIAHNSPSGNDNESTNVSETTTDQSKSPQDNNILDPADTASPQSQSKPPPSTTNPNPDSSRAQSPDNTSTISLGINEGMGEGFDRMLEEFVASTRCLSWDLS